MPIQDKIVETAITFDDVLLVPSFSEVLPNQVSLKSRLTDKITLNVPIVSAAMDTVTESDLAIALARVGGLGFIHKNMPIEEQAAQVNKVKRSENGMIADPVTLSKDYTLREAKELMSRYKISGLPVVDNNNTLIGIITNRDVKYQENLDMKVEELMTKDNLVTSDKNTTLETAKNILLENRVEKLPIVDENFKLVGLITIKDIDNQLEYPHANKDKNGRLIVGAGVGVGEDTMERVTALVKAGVDIIAIDSAHGHSKGVLDKIKEIRQAFPDLDIVGGNIVTAEAAKDLIEAGANVLKVGVGPGSICTTRVVAGVGVPQLSAIYNVYEYAQSKNVAVIADGGIKLSGDIVKAIASGANAVMLGSLFAGTDEAPGEEIIFQGRKFKSYQGMGSLAAMKRGGKERYFQSEAKKFVPEGIEGRVPHKGKLEDVVFQLTGGLRAGMGYCGAKDIKSLQTDSKMVKITGSGLKESHPHDVIITQEAPNYSL
ncbi:IMP dehydrogenase [Riemerella anatipestifer]|uniref:Inosine-5'-monophosphate dehydrogenase n=2 Tax=Riemerella anatipestifer TaxID=34085 RepID=E4TCX2_RIEAD|nr:IMP dehydrogenase [Riemerella anatipestifer]ADQ82631.1 inosine-5'-monophosphate dehydrogenase [Riemerella anatipestifer ATCC 11845 = DSM 15868]ADZ11877.1 IMP dehydrogenase/GMP reductase [Riemerella anatipestifer RA-GD]AFD56640.1 inosine-5'-monophosphate dehydrogenase [Riemerella anatipestifer ATCC 11845 = DSM 15868]AGC39383.1 IMP dehydrogenase/GMP reductase [Riemerella anatipestifer RA-CH-2]AKP69819.1 inosine-5'-monophosphate dehydrogenase [Riemerella anatipestifer]